VPSGRFNVAIWRALQIRSRDESGAESLGNTSALANDPWGPSGSAGSFLGDGGRERCCGASAVCLLGVGIATRFACQTTFSTRCPASARKYSPKHRNRESHRNESYKLCAERFTPASGLPQRADLLGVDGKDLHH
jgi:hypothetical protein